MRNRLLRLHRYASDASNSFFQTQPLAVEEEDAVQDAEEEYVMLEYRDTDVKQQRKNSPFAPYKCLPISADTTHTVAAPHVVQQLLLSGLPALLRVRRFGVLQDPCIRVLCYNCIEQSSYLVFLLCSSFPFESLPVLPESYHDS